MTAHDPHGDARVLHHGPHVNAAGSVLICLHGRGVSAEDAIALGLAVLPSEAALLAPQASGFSWYPNSFLAPIDSNQPYLDSAMELLSRLVSSLRDQGVARDRTMIIGFSQGACLACEYAARHPQAVSRVAALTGALIGERLDEDRYPEALEPVQMLMTTGVPDAHVPHERVSASAELLNRRGHSCEVELYPHRQHTVSSTEVALARALFLKAPHSYEDND